MKKLAMFPLWVLLSLLVGCASKAYYNTDSAKLENKVCPGKTMNFDRELASEKRLQIALHKIKSGFIEQAKENLDCAMRYSPKSVAVHRVYAFYFESVKEYEDAEIAYRHAIKLAPKDPETLNQYGAFLCERGKADKAIQYFLKAISIPEYTRIPDSYENAGICSIDAGKVAQAEGFFRRALAYNANSAKSLLEMAEIHFDRNEVPTARSYINRYANFAEHSARSLWLAMRIEQKLGNKNALGSYGIKLERMFPDAVETAYYLQKKRQWQR